MQKTMLMAALSATLAMAAATVQAQDPMPPKPAPPPPATPAPPAAPMSWSALDANGNGTLDAGEAAIVARARNPGADRAAGFVDGG